MDPDENPSPVREYWTDVTELAGDYLAPNGWFTSLRLGRSVDAAGNPLPWITYPAIEMLKRIDTRDARVFEYGAGNSSIWWAARAREVVSVEYDADWQRFVSQEPTERNRIRVIEKGAQLSPDIAQWLEREFFDKNLDPEPSYKYGPSPSVACRPFMAYATSLLQYPVGYFDVIVIDGAARVLCSWLSTSVLADDGLIVFDNTDRVIYAKGYEHLAQKGFGRLDFWGPSPINRFESCTSFFAKSLGPFLAKRRVEVKPRPEHCWR
jgi:hypothetical protein